MSVVLIEASHVTAQLAGRTVLTDVSLTVREGEVVALLGPNGAGKSTLLRVLAGLLGFDGKVMIEGRDLRTFTDRERAQRIAYVPQKSLLTAPMRVWDVVALGRYCHQAGPFGASEEDRSSVLEALETVRITHLRDRAFTELSGGEQRRVLLARALATGARLLLLDEPTSALDVRHSLSFLSTVRDLARESRAIVLALHDLSEALESSHRALLLNEGQVIAHGPSEDVVSQAPIQSAYGVELVRGGGLGFRLLP